jgi:uncharacterized protein
MHSIQGTITGLETAGFEKNIISGECRMSVREIAQTAEVEFGVWEGTSGSWRSEWDSWEFFTIIAGKGTLTDSTGTTHVLEAGTCVWIPAGSKARWQVDEPLRKSYVIPARDSQR